jgi:hypothetical protein
MEEKRRLMAAQRGFRHWRSRFSETFHENTSPADLSDRTLRSLIQPGEETMGIIYEFVSEVKGLGPENRFHLLEAPDKMAVMDIALFILDQFRFECMRRLGWVELYPTCHTPLVDLIEQFPEGFAHLKHHTPSLAPTHPRYGEYEATFEDDRGVFIRRLIPQALEAFGKSK